ncbi:ATP-grasp domain-containing protein [Halomonas sp. AOP42-C2-25]|uniref:ATP-grasp domain-containing protein n=1 Tax=Halomonas sp. AOP42-C2-25 TaxID=3457668 RepID=UPI004033AFE9
MNITLKPSDSCENSGSDRKLNIEGCELFVYKKQKYSKEERHPTYSVAISASIGSSKVSIVRHGYIMSKAGRVPMLNRSMVECALEHFPRELELASLDVKEVRKALYLLRDEACLSSIDENGDELKHTVESLGDVDDIDPALLMEKAKSRLRPFRLAINDLIRFVSNEYAASKSPKEECYVDGEKIPRKFFLSDVFNNIEDYMAFPLPKKPFIYGKEIVEYSDYRELKLLKKNGTKGFLFYYYALGYGLSATRLSKFSLVTEDKHRNNMLFSWSTSQLSSIVSHAFCVDKEATRQILNEQGLPVPAGRAFEPKDITSALEYAELIGYPVVCKPLNGSKGEGVVVNIKKKEELLAAIKTLERSVYKDSDFIVEKYIKGKDYRIVVVGNEVKGALCRELASVTGDGIHSTAELMLAKHAWRMKNPHFIERSAFIEEDSAFGNINDFSIDLLRVPELNEHVVFGTSCNLSQGADSVDVLDELHPSIKEAAVKATEAIPGLRYCGVDILIEDHTKDIASQSAAIIELNAKAAIGNCEYPMFGKPREVVKSIFTTVAEDFGIDIPKVFNEGSCKVVCEVKGSIDKKEYIRWAYRSARQLGVDLKIKELNSPKIHIEIEGSVKVVSMMATRLVVGPKSSRPYSVKTRLIA